MANDPQTELRLARLENDSNSLYDLVTEIRSVQQEHSRRFDSVRATLAEMRATFAEMRATLAEIVRRLPEPS